MTEGADISWPRPDVGNNERESSAVFHIELRATAGCRFWFGMGVLLTAAAVLECGLLLRESTCTALLGGQHDPVGMK